MAIEALVMASDARVERALQVPRVWGGAEEGPDKGLSGPGNAGDVQRPHGRALGVVLPPFCWEGKVPGLPNERT